MPLTFTTLIDAVREVAKGMGLTNGTNMTPYSDDLVVSYILQAHELIKAEHAWDEMERGILRTPDGVTGKVTELITDCTDWKLIRRIYQQGFQTPLPKLSTYINPLMTPIQLGYIGLAPQDDNDTDAGRYLVQFFPVTTVAQVFMVVESTFDFTDTELVIPIDFWLHVYYACWLWACEDGTNPLQVTKYEKLLKKRMEQVTMREASRPSLSQPNQMIPNEWWEQDSPYQ